MHAVVTMLLGTVIVAVVVGITLAVDERMIRSRNLAIIKTRDYITAGAMLLLLSVMTYGVGHLCVDYLL